MAVQLVTAAEMELLVLGKGGVVFMLDKADVIVLSVAFGLTARGLIEPVGEYTCSDDRPAYWLAKLTEDGELAVGG